MDPSINTLWQYYPMNTELQQRVFLNGLIRYRKESAGKIEFMPETRTIYRSKKQNITLR